MIMKKVAYVIILWLTASLLAGGCSLDTKEDAGEEVLVNLDISVALSDVAQTLARGVKEDAGPANDDEKMQKLRVVVVRENGIVEKNGLMNLSQPAVMNERLSERLKVVSKEWKQIYLFVNEDNEKIKVGHGDSDESVSLTSFLESMAVGSVFPTEEISELTVRLDMPSGQLEGALPMSECHWVYVPKKDHECELFVTRSAVKFSFRITNKGSKDSKLTELTIKNMMDKEYYLPRNAKYENEEIDGNKYLALQTYDIPSFAKEYDYKQEGLEISLPVNKEVALKPIYLLEGKHEGAYSVGIKVNGANMEGVLENLPRKLPRNTHVVVNITINNKNLEFEVNVEPYREVELEPGFGIN